ncbi:hypothetical protein [Salinibacterium sp. ZJ450]|uniref:hypothetical protein n=1 Tax=Salinibacterium sp. ZJ450 TaxID=2708338 RepID=UPI0014248716|nr:hypothetical protein [Salinibacterium sp. ZJ450]
MTEEPEPGTGTPSPAGLLADGEDGAQNIERTWWEPVWIRTLLGLALVPAWAYAIHWLAPLTTIAVHRDADIGGIVAWGVIAAIGFALLGLATTALSPTHKPALPGWSLALLGLLALGMLTLQVLLATTSLEDTPIGAEAAASVTDWLRGHAPHIYIPVTLAIVVSAFAQRVMQSRARFWSWIGITLGAAPFIVVAGKMILLSPVSN